MATFKHNAIYRGKRVEGNCHIFVFENPHGAPVAKIDPARSLKLRNHSPTGFEWGYGGSGPAQLALALLLDFTDNDTAALTSYQAFKADVVAAMPRPDRSQHNDEADSWELTGEEIWAWFTGTAKPWYFRQKWDGARTADTM